MASTLCLIPARGGSKRIPRKNIRHFLGKPVIGYSIEAAKKAEIFDQIVVSTDSAEISEVSLKFGAKIPFLRDSKLSGDDTPTLPVVRDAITRLGLLDTDILCLIYPVAPLIEPNDLKKAYEISCRNPNNLVSGLVEYRYPVQRALKKNQSGSFSMIVPENLEKLSQEFEPAFHDAGQFYFGRVSTWMTIKSMLSETQGVIISDWAAQDIDDEGDWQYSEYLYEILLKARH